MKKIPITISVCDDEQVRDYLERIKSIAEQIQNDELKTAAMLLEKQLETPLANIYVDCHVEPINHAPWEGGILRYK